MINFSFVNKIFTSYKRAIFSEYTVDCFLVQPSIEKYLNIVNNT